jgi:hypothetical protein
MRPVVDRAVLQLIDTVTFTGADFSIQHDGVCRMNPELARRVAQLALEHRRAVQTRAKSRVRDRRKKRELPASVPWILPQPWISRL